MKPTDYDTSLADTIFREVLFTIDPDQFDVPLPFPITGHFDTAEQAKAVAQDAADFAGHAVEVVASGHWGHYGREYIDTLTFQPEVKVA